MENENEDEKKENLKQRKEKINDFFKKFTKDKYKTALIALLIFALIIRLFFFLQNYGQVVWWDEAENLLMANHFAKGTPSTGFGGHRELGLPIILAPIFFLGLGEIGSRILLLLVSLATIYLVYLLGKEMYTKNIGLIAAFLMSSYHLHLFFTLRLIANVPDTFFWTLLTFLFWKGFVQRNENEKLTKQNKKYIMLLFIAGAIGSTVYALVASSSLMFLTFLFLRERFAFLKQKVFWLGLFLAILIISPYFIYAALNPDPDVVTRFEKAVRGKIEFEKKGEWSWSNFFIHAKYFKTHLGPYLLPVFILGILYLLFNLVLGIDLLFKKDLNLAKTVLLFMWVALPYMFFSYSLARCPSCYLEPRGMVSTFPAVFIITAIGFSKIYDWTKKFRKELAFAIILILLLLGTSYQLTLAASMITGKASSYGQVRESSLWIKENSLPGDWIFTNSVPHTTYYAERPSKFDFTNKSHFETLAKELKPKYMVVSIYERSPGWYYKWAPEHPSNVMPAKSYFITQNTQQQPSLVIYKFLNYDF